MTAAYEPALRPPAVPLITCDPYFSIWSFDDELHGGTTRHWTGAAHPLVLWVKIDDKVYRVMGAAAHSLPGMEQLGLEVLPTQTIYRFQSSGIRLTLRFTTPMLPHDLELLSRPVSYITWDIQAVDGKKHAVSVYFEVDSHLVVNTRDQEVMGGRVKLDGLNVLRLGSFEQPVLEKVGDNLRIDWGYLYVATPSSRPVLDVIAGREQARTAFLTQGTLPASDDLRQPRKARDQTLVAAMVFDIGPVDDEPVSHYVLLAYDDLYSVEYFHRKLPAYWKKGGRHIGDLLVQATAEYADVMERASAFDMEVMDDLEKVGGRKYAQVAALAFRQSLAAHKLTADIDGTPLFFSKENFSNGCIATVDVTYPTSPLFLVFNTELLKAALRPILTYASLDQWPFPFAPHDLGTYPLANGQVYGGGEQFEENQMPVEECGNMLIMTASVCIFEGSVDFAAPYKELLGQWAEYLETWGFDPELQLCTDDFAGHLARNANLSIKAIVALGAYASLCRMFGDESEAEHFMDVARSFANEWLKAADDGDHYRLTFDRSGSWSQKYNLVWDKLLNLNLFPADVARKEIAFYKTQQNLYGLPLDSRKAWTKLDWIVWTATLAESREDFEAFIEPVYRFVNESESRVPLTDWYWTTDATQVGFQARPVVGGVFIKMLADPYIRQKWLNRQLHVG